MTSVDSMNWPDPSQIAQIQETTCPIVTTLDEKQQVCRLAVNSFNRRQNHNQEAAFHLLSSTQIDSVVQLKVLDRTCAIRPQEDKPKTTVLVVTEKMFLVIGILERVHVFNTLKPPNGIVKIKNWNVAIDISNIYEATILCSNPPPTNNSSSFSRLNPITDNLFPDLLSDLLNPDDL